ncbi:MAG TPA: hypothetical protein VND65_01885 [Candidatus Binatia bacterium]|nr:hypothetical protein [Candidatus Binatia bacterium]
MNILALDLATTTGFASEIRGFRSTGFKNFAPRGTEGPGWRWIRFSVWLYTWKDQPLELVVIERPIPNPNNRHSGELAFGLSTRVEEFCARQNLRLETLHNATVKKYFTGDGRAEKEDMIRMAQRIDPKIENDNEADALLLLQYAKLVTLKKRKEVF